jgi:hypothetical protein
MALAQDEQRTERRLRDRVGGALTLGHLPETQTLRTGRRARVPHPCRSSLSRSPLLD